MRYALAAALAVLSASSALAMGPSVTDFPATINLASCKKWAASQDSEAKEFWGLMTSGKSSAEVGLMRLTLNCLGDDQPEIINVGASVGAAEQYCATHAKQPVCRGIR